LSNFCLKLYCYANNIITVLQDLCFIDYHFTVTYYYLSQCLPISLKQNIQRLYHRISIPAYAIEQQWRQSGVPKKWNVINAIYIQKWCSLFSKALYYVCLFQEFVDTPVNSRPSLFGIDSVHQMETSISHALLVYKY
jgi:hypothetical protein